MKSTKLEVVLLSAAALIALIACDTTDSDNSNKDIKSSSAVVTKNNTASAPTTVSLMIENNAERYQKYEDIDKGQKSEEVYTDFISTVKSDEDYGNDPLQNKNLAIILYKLDYPDCRKAEPEIMQEIKGDFSYAPTLVHDITINKLAYEYHAIAVDITDGIPEWVQSIRGLADKNNQYHTPTVAVATPEKANGTLYWDVMGVTTNTTDKMTESTIEYYMDLGAYELYQ